MRRPEADLVTSLPPRPRQQLIKGIRYCLPLIGEGPDVVTQLVHGHRHQTVPSQRRVLVGKGSPHSGVHGIPVGSAGVRYVLTRSLALCWLFNKIDRQ